MFKYASVVAFGVLAAAAASAQTTDAPTWTGPYVGIHGGYGFDDGSKVTDTGIASNNVAALASGIRPYSLNQNRGGVLGGGQLGYNMQRGNIVFGAEGDFSYTHQRGDNALFGTTGRRTYLTSDLDWMGTARARAGYVFGRGMIFGTGGYAFGRVKGAAEFDSDTVGAANYYGSHKYLAQGWTAGGGLEFRPFAEGMMSRVSFRLETDYYDLGRSHIYSDQVSDRPGYYVLGVETRGYNAKFGINYAF